MTEQNELKTKKAFILEAARDLGHRLAAGQCEAVVLRRTVAGLAGAACESDALADQKGPDRDNRAAEPRADRRLARLEALLSDLSGQELLPSEVIVVDNDVNGTARTAVERFLAARPPFPVRYDPNRDRAAADPIRPQRSGPNPGRG